MDGDAGDDRDTAPDPDALLERAGLDAEALARRRAAIGFDDADARRLAELQPHLRERRGEIVEHVTAAVGDGDGADPANGSAKCERVERAWRTELTTLGRGTYDESFARDRADVALQTTSADVPLSAYLAVHGRTYDRVFADLEARVVNEIETAIEEWADEETAVESDGGVFGGLRSAVGGASDDGTSAAALDGLRDAIRGAVADGMADASALARVGALDAGIATDATNERHRRRADAAERRHATLYDDLDDAVAEPLGNVHETASSVAESAATITDLAGAQAEEVPAAADELDDLSATVEEVAATAEEVREASAETEERAEAGLDSAREAVDEMEAVRTATDGLVTVVEELEERAERIEAIAEDIDDVASRSKVLASNAQGQANREVDAKRSLQVLSEEVGAFADETREQLGELPAEVTALQEVAEAVGREVERADERVTEGADRVVAVECEIEAMADVAETTANHMDEVAAATDRQATAAESISESVDRLARRSQQIAAETETVAAATEEQAAALGSVVEELEALQAEHAPDDGES